MCNGLLYLKKDKRFYVPTREKSTIDISQPITLTVKGKEMIPDPTMVLMTVVIV